MPALPLDEAGKYVAAAYLVFLALLLIYVAIMAMKLNRIDRELAELADLAEPPDNPEEHDPSGSQPDGLGAGGQDDARGVAAGQASGREQSTHREVSAGDA